MTGTLAANVVDTFFRCPICGSDDFQLDGRNDVCVCLSCGYTNVLAPYDYDAYGYTTREQGV